MQAETEWTAYNHPVSFMPEEVLELRTPGPKYQKMLFILFWNSLVAAPCIKPAEGIQHYLILNQTIGQSKPVLSVQPER